MSGNPRKRSLFTREDGGPMCFSLMPCQERREIRELLEYGGGLLVQPDRRSDAIRLVPSFITTVADGSDDVFSSNYIRACSENNKLYPLKDFRVPVAPVVLDDSKGRTLRSVHSRREYTLEEDKAIAKFIAERPGVLVGGNAVYMEMAAAGVVGGKHSWQSLKQRYLKTIQPLRHLYESPEAASSLAQGVSEESGGARGSSRRRKSPEEHILVEDTDSGDSFSPKRKRPAIPELESSEGSSTEAEVIAETESQTTPPSEQPETPVSKVTKDERRRRPNPNSSTVSLVTRCDEEASTTQHSPQKPLGQKAARKTNSVKSTNRQRSSSKVPSGKLNVQASLWQAQERTSNKPSGSASARPTDPETAVLSSSSPSNKQKTLLTSPKQRRKGPLGSAAGHPSAQEHAESVCIDSDSEFEVSGGLNESTAKGVGRNLEPHCSDRSRKRSSRHSSTGRPKRVPSPGNTRQPTQSSLGKRGGTKPAEDSVGQPSTALHPKSRNTNDRARETDLQNPLRPTGVAEGLNLPAVPLLGARKKKGIPAPSMCCEKQTLSSEKQTMPPKGNRNVSRLRSRAKPTSSAKGSDKVPDGDSSATSVPPSGSAAEHQPPSSPPKEQQRGTLPVDPGGRLSNAERLESGGRPSEADSKDPPQRAHASVGSRVKTRSLSKSPTKRASRYGQSKETHPTSTEEQETGTSVGAETPSQQNEPPSSVKGSGKEPDLESSATGAGNSTSPPKRVPSSGGKLRRRQLSAQKQVGVSIGHHLESSCNDDAASETDSEDPVGLRRVVRASLLRPKLVQDQSETNGASSRGKSFGEQAACPEKQDSSARTAASSLRKHTRPSKSAGERGAESEENGTQKKDDADRGEFDSADELLLEQATRRAPDSPMSLDSADENLLARITEPCSDNASTVTLSSEPAVASPVTIQSGSWRSGEDAGAESDRDSIPTDRQRLAKSLGASKEGEKVLSSGSAVASPITVPSSSECSEEDTIVESDPDRDSIAADRRRLAKLLGALKEGKKVPPHASVACPLDCRCPRSTECIRSARAAVALGACLAYRDSRLPSDCPGAKDPKVAILLEVLLRRLEGGDAGDKLS